MIAGHEAHHRGRHLLDGRNVTDLPPTGRGTAMMFQNYALFPHLNCLDNVAFGLKMQGVPRASGTRAGAYCSSWSDGAATPHACRRSCPAGSSSASRWPAR